MATKKEAEAWMKKYRAAFADEVDIDLKQAREIINEDMAQKAFEKGCTPERAGRQDARFAFFGK